MSEKDQKLARELIDRVKRSGVTSLQGQSEIANKAINELRSSNLSENEKLQAERNILLEVKRSGSLLKAQSETEFLKAVERDKRIESIDKRLLDAEASKPENETPKSDDQGKIRK